jgi:hypothetical protein
MRRRTANKTPCNIILQTKTGSKCRLCQQLDEPIDHMISACPVLAKEQYVKRHDSGFA